MQKSYTIFMSGTLGLFIIILSKIIVRHFQDKKFLDCSMSFIYFFFGRRWEELDSVMWLILLDQIIASD